MQEDFHYYCTAVLARAAGFTPKDALTIGYAAQYVDDAVESEPIHIGDIKFDPTRTAHLGLKAFEWGVQKKVFIPFHFIPPHEIVTGRESFVTERGKLIQNRQVNKQMIHQLLDEAFAEPDKEIRLCRIGIALHTYADTWSHMNFSGRQDEENDVARIQIWNRKNNKWKDAILKNLVYDYFVPKIGHAQAYKFPDYPYLRWRYKQPQTGKTITRDNTALFLDAAVSILNQLTSRNKSQAVNPIPWLQLEKKLTRCLSNEKEKLEDRTAKWVEVFGDFFTPSADYHYDKLTWREEALGKGVDWQDNKPGDFEKMHFELKPGFYRKNWVLFHHAALKQRHYVLERML